MRPSERRSVTQMFTTDVVSATLSSFLCQPKALRGSPTLALLLLEVHICDKTKGLLYQDQNNQNNQLKAHSLEKLLTLTSSLFTPYHIIYVL